MCVECSYLRSQNCCAVCCAVSSELTGSTDLEWMESQIKVTEQTRLQEQQEMFKQAYKKETGASQEIYESQKKSSVCCMNGKHGERLNQSLICVCAEYGL